MSIDELTVDDITLAGEMSKLWYPSNLLLTVGFVRLLLNRLERATSCLGGKSLMLAYNAASAQNIVAMMTKRNA